MREAINQTSRPHRLGERHRNRPAIRGTLGAADPRDEAQPWILKNRFFDPIMQRLLSTYFIRIAKIDARTPGADFDAKFQGIEIFCARSHFEYAAKAEVQAMAGALEAHKLRLVSLHGPTSRDLSAMRESGTPLSICEVERGTAHRSNGRIEARDHVADDLPYAR